MRSRYGWVAISLALSLCLLAWGRLVFSTVTKPSAAHVVEFFGTDGTPLAERAYCSGNSFVAAPYVWKLCSLAADGRRRPVRFDLAQGRADLLWEPIGSDFFPAAIARSTDRGGLVVAPRFSRGVVRLRSSGGYDDLGFTGEAGGRSCLRWNGDALELIRVHDSRVERAVLSAGSWAEAPFAAPSFGPETTVGDGRVEQGTHRAKPIGCLWQDEWHAVWARYELDQGPDSMVELFALTEAGERLWELTLTVPKRPLAFRTLLASVDQTSGGGVLGPMSRGRLVLSEGGLDRVDGASWGEVDYVLRENRLEVVDIPSLVQRLGSDFKAEDFVPDGRGGYWATARSGRRFTRFDSTLRRTDDQGFVARMQGALSVTHGKERAGFFDRGAWLKKGLFLWVVFVVPVFGVVLLAGWKLAHLSRQKVLEVALGLSLLYLIVSILAVPFSFWRLSGALW